MSAPSEVSENPPPEPSSAPKPKRRRLALSCERCRVRKIRCDTQEGKCAPCTAANVPCVVPDGKSREETGTNKPKIQSPGNIDNLASSVPPSGSTSHRQADQHLQPQGARAQHQFTSYPVPIAPKPAGPHVSPKSKATQVAIQQPAGLASTSAESVLHGRVNDHGLVHHQDEHRSKFIGALSNQSFIKWLDQDSNSKRKLASHFRYAVADAEEFNFPGLDEPRPPLPSEPQLSQYLDAYFQNSHPMFPCVDEEDIRDYVANYKAYGQPSVDDYCSMPLLYVVCAIGADALATTKGMLTGYGQQYLQYTWKSLPAFLARPYRKSAQILLLMAIAFRGRFKEGIAWGLTGYAIRICHSLGLHLDHGGPVADLDARIWYTAYTLDKMGSFDSGRPSAIRDHECTVTLSALKSGSTDGSVSASEQGFSILASLAQELSSIMDRLFSAPASTMSLFHAFVGIGRCDAALTRWAEDLPLEFKPTNETPLLGPNFTRAASIFFVYHQALIALHRISLFTSDSFVVSNLTSPELRPYMQRLRSGKSICLNSARAILALLEPLTTHYTACRHWSLHVINTALYVLAVGIQRQPTSWQAKADLSLLKPACELIEQLYRDAGFEPGFCSLLPALYQKIEFRVFNPSLPSRMVSRQASPVAEQADESNAGDLNGQFLPGGQAAAPGEWVPDFGSGFNTLDDINIDDFFPLLFGAGFTSDPLADITNPLLQDTFGTVQQSPGVGEGQGSAEAGPFDFGANGLNF